MGRERTYEIAGQKVTSGEARAFVRRRDGRLCHVCGKPVLDGLPAFDPQQATLDHVVEHAAGGSNDVGNLRLAHRVCNEQRSAEFGRARQNPAKRREYRARREATSLTIYKDLLARGAVRRR